MIYANILSIIFLNRNFLKSFGFFVFNFANKLLLTLKK